MYSVLIKGFETKQQAKDFMRWYDSSGEQDAQIWFENGEDTRSPFTVYKTNIEPGEIVEMSIEMK